MKIDSTSELSNNDGIVTLTEILTTIQGHFPSITDTSNVRSRYQDNRKKTSKNIRATDKGTFRNTCEVKFIDQIHHTYSSYYTCSGKY